MKQTKQEIEALERELDEFAKMTDKKIIELAKQKQIRFDETSKKIKEIKKEKASKKIKETKKVQTPEELKRELEEIERELDEIAKTTDKKVLRSAKKPVQKKQQKWDLDENLTLDELDLILDLMNVERFQGLNLSKIAKNMISQKDMTKKKGPQPIQKSKSVSYFSGHVIVEYTVYHGREETIKTASEQIAFQVMDLPKETFNERHDQIKKDALGEIVDLYNFYDTKFNKFLSIDIKKTSAKEYSEIYKTWDNRVLRKSSVTRYHFTSADGLNIPEKDGQCVANALFTLFQKSDSKRLKNKTLDDIENDLNKEHENECEGNDCQHKRDGGHPFNHIRPILKREKISYYVLDVFSKLKEKYVAEDNAWQKRIPAFICYIIDSHLYTVDDKKSRNRIVKQFCRSKKDNSLEDFKVKNDEHTDKFLGREIKYNVDLDELPTLKNCNVFYDVNSLKEILVKLFLKHNTNYKCKMIDNKVTMITFDLDKKVFLYNNPNFLAGLNFETMKQFADLFNIEFKNESLTMLGKNIWESFNNHSNITPRIQIKNKKNLINELLEEQEKKCKACHRDFGNGIKYELDHIIRLRDGGDLTARDNLQLLCSECQTKKTEKENLSQYFSENRMESHYNSITQKIFSQKKNAFIFGQEISEEMNLYGIDIVKCRRNIIYNLKYDLPVFFSLDEPEVFIDQDIVPGYYFVSTNNNFPFKRSNWYSQPIVQYGLDKKIISKKMLL